MVLSPRGDSRIKKPLRNQMLQFTQAPTPNSASPKQISMSIRPSLQDGSRNHTQKIPMPGVAQAQADV